MRNFPAQQYTSINKSENDVSSPTKANKPDWMKRLQEKKKKEEIAYQTKNVDLSMFPSSMHESHSSYITYLEDENDLAASYFPDCNDMGSSMSSIEIDDLPAISGYKFGERIKEKNTNKKEEEVVQQAKNIDFGLFPSLMSESQNTEITYLEDEDDLAASYFPKCDKIGSSNSSNNTDDLPAVSGYNFGELIG